MMDTSDSGCKETLSDFFNQWTSIKKKLSSGRSTTLKNYDDLVHNISENLEEIEKSIHSLTKWKKEVAEVFKFLHPNVTRLIEGLETENNEGVDIINDLKRIKDNVHEIKNGTEHIVKLPRVEPKPEPKKRQSICWKQNLMFEEGILASPAMAMAKSIYHGLEPRVKLCFLTLSIFPENSSIRKRSLIYWWIGEGFVDGEDAERKAEECFDKLCNSGLVEAVGEQYSRSPRSCRLHPWIRWMAIEIAKETMFFDFDSDGKPYSGPSHCTRRAFVATSGGEEEEVWSEKVNLKPDASKLESLFNLDVNCIEFDEEEFKKLKKLVTLQLGRWRTAAEHHIELLNPTFLEHLKLLKNLRYLGLQGISRITELSDIQQLSELRVLDLRGCHNLEKLPAGIASLKKLTHLDVSECYLLEYMPKGLGDLSELQLLNGFVVNTWNQNACKVSELTKLGNLKKLSISLGMEAIVINGVLDPIGEIEGLKSLRITWAWGSTTDKAIKKSNIDLNWSKKALFLPPKLTKLDLQCYPEEEPPMFVRKLEKETSLEKLYFRGGRLNSLSGIQSNEVSEVKFIRLRFLKDFAMEENVFKIKFPSLQRMIPSRCPHILYGELVFLTEENASSLTKDEASTSTNPST